ncbi:MULTISPECIES: hypothetical protein [Nostoc]|uniref:Uncharacterized protein n=2 Tax=Nostoc TaxID=1177 RepID=A0ABR8IF75_9NOSO|nr:MULTISPECIES: hypothetical protein [Nostoc]MBD2565179.1 hypothetical protein [Nostoc linckia FACHB-391]MBD2649587.1 hypothetical protein [Nostoc foliaceum FACHB-393]
MPQQKFLQLTPIDSRIRIPQHYQRQPLISGLVSRYSHGQHHRSDAHANRKLWLV